MTRSGNRDIRIPIPGHDVTMTRRAFGAVVAGAVFAGIAWAANLASGGTEEEVETLYVDDEEEPECDEYEERVTTGELAAHIGCAIALSAIDNEDYNQMLKDLGLYGNEPGKYTYSGGNIWQHLHDNAGWRASQPYYQAGRTDNKRGDIFTFGLDEMPNRALPNANVYIDWKMGKGLLPEYGEYVAPEELGLHPVSDRWAPADEYVDVVERNKKAVDQYGTFAQCGAVPVHIHLSMGLEPYASGLWRYFVRTMKGGGNHPMSEVLPEPAECGNYWIYPYDSSVAFDDFCKPGDMLVWSHDAEPVATHFALYVGNDIAKRYFPNTTGNVCEAGAGGRFCGITRYGVKPWGADWLFVCRPKNIAVNMRQDLPPLKLHHGCAEDEPMDESARRALERIRDMESGTDWCIACDYDMHEMHLFFGSAGNWHLRRSFPCVTGRDRYFGNELHRGDAAAPPGCNPTAIGTFYLPSDKRKAICNLNTSAPMDCWITQYTGGRAGTGADFIHAYVSPGPTTESAARGEGRDLIVDFIAKDGPWRASGGCLMPEREHAIFIYENIGEGSLCYVWTEEPARTSDAFESAALRDVMVSKGYCDVSELTGDESSLATPNSTPWG